MDISVVIPTYNRPECLQCCLLSLVNQTTDKQWEVIVVDDGGIQDLSKVVVLVSNRISVQLIRQNNAGPAAARNNGVAHASGRYIAFLDDDCEPDRDWLKHLSEGVTMGEMIGGRTENKLSKNLYSEASQQLVSFLYEYFQGSPWWFFTSNNFLVDKESFESISGFNQDFPTSAGEDREFCAKWLAKGFRMKYEPSAIVNHAHDLTIKTYWKQHLKYGKASPQYRDAIASLGLSSPPFKLSFYFDLIFFSFRNGKGGIFNKLFISRLLVISQIATVVGFLTSSKGKK